MTRQPLGRAQGKQKAQDIVAESREVNGGDISYPYLFGRLNALLEANQGPGGKPYPAEFIRGLGQGLRIYGGAL